MNIPEKIFKAYDIRGIYPEELNEENVVSITKGIFKLFSTNLQKENLQIVVGRDMRHSSPQIFEAVTNTLISLGVDVIDIGLVSTPTFYFAVFSKGFDGGIMISASHNPPEFNGLKMVQKSANGLMKISGSAGIEKIKQWSIEGVEVAKKPGGKVTKLENIAVEEVENALRIAGNPNYKNLKIVVDPANAMGAVYIEEFFKKVSADLIKINFELDGSFPAHPADPLEKENLYQLREKVKETGADLGIATDGDGDRIFFVDEKGEIIPASLTISLIAKELLKDHLGETIVIDVRYILNSKKVIEDNGGKFEIVRVGHAFITEKLNEVQGIYAGESSGHMYFRETGGCESGVTVIALILKALSEQNKPFSEVLKEIKYTFESGEINFELNNSQEVLEKVKQKYSDGDFSSIDGVSISYPGVRFNIRSSNTGVPLLRLNVEGYDVERVKKVTEEVSDLIKENTKI